MGLPSFILPIMGKSAFSNRYYAAFGGTNEYAIKSGYSLNGYTAFTVSLWMRTTASVGTSYIFSSPDASAGSNGCDIYQAGSTLRATVRTTANTTLDTGLAYNDGAWHNVLLWYDGANCRIYVDDTQRATAVKTGTVDNSANEINLARFGSFGGYIVVDLDEVAIWNSALDATARTAVYNSGTPGNLINASIPTPAAWWRWDDALDDMTGTTGTIRDQIGSNHLTPFNTESADKVLY